MKYIFTLLLLISLQSAQAQYDSLYMAVLPFNSNTEKGKIYIASVRAYVIESLSADYRFVLLERDELNVAAIEREYQKSEDFIDGKIVEQGKALGAEYMLDGFYDAKSNKLSFAIYDVATGALKCSIVAEREIPKDATGLVKILYKLDDLNTMLEGGQPRHRRPPPKTKPTKAVVVSNIRQLMKECFPSSLYWAVLRTESGTNNKSKTLLIAAGTRMGLKKGSIVEVLNRVIEEVDGFPIERYESVGWGRVMRFENESFCIIQLEDGGRSIKKLLKAKKKLKCRYVKK